MGSSTTLAISYCCWRAARRSVIHACLVVIVSSNILNFFGIDAVAEVQRNTTTPARTRPSTPSADGNNGIISQVSQALQSGNTVQAMNLCHTALRHTPGDPRLWTLQAIAQTSGNDHAGAIASYRSALKAAPKYLPAWQGMAQLQYSARDPLARQTLEHLVTLAPQDMVAHAMLGALAYSRKDCPAAVNEFEKARPVVSGRSDTAQQWGSCLVQLGKPQEAATLLAATLGTAPNDSTLRYDTALAQWKGGNAAAAQQTLDPLIKSPQPSSDSLALGAEIAEDQGDTQQALDLLRAAILADPKNRDAYLDYARLAYEHASAQVGIDMVNIGLRNLPNDAELYFARGVLYAQDGKMDQTMADLNRASELDPHLSLVGTAQGIAAAQAHQFAAAEQRLREQTRAHPSDAAAWYLFAESLANQSLEPNNPKHKEMVHAAEEAVRLNPKSADAHSQLASIYLRDNNTLKAIAECNAALAVNPDDPQTLYQLVLAMRKTGQKDQLAPLVKRMMAAREIAEAKEKSERKQRLSELPTVTPQGRTP